MLVRLKGLIINTDNICCISKLKHPDEWEVKFVSGLTRVLVGYEVEKIVEADREYEQLEVVTGDEFERRLAAHIPSPVEQRAGGE